MTNTLFPRIILCNTILESTLWFSPVYFIIISSSQCGFVVTWRGNVKETKYSNSLSIFCKRSIGPFTGFHCRIYFLKFLPTIRVDYGIELSGIYLQGYQKDIENIADHHTKNHQMSHNGKMRHFWHHMLQANFHSKTRHTTNHKLQAWGCYRSRWESRFRFYILKTYVDLYWSWELVFFILPCT